MVAVVPPSSAYIYTTQLFVVRSVDAMCLLETDYSERLQCETWAQSSYVDNSAYSTTRLSLLQLQDLNEGNIKGSHFLSGIFF